MSVLRPTHIFNNLYDNAAKMRNLRSICLHHAPDLSHPLLKPRLRSNLRSDFVRPTVQFRDKPFLLWKLLRDF
ncbi:hypothetical protein FIU97_12435 [Roseivivax sp. THAF40]|nr:hypothetical protein FIU97_12435 [Roseivivax sp. THAF40]